MYRNSWHGNRETGFAKRKTGLRHPESGFGKAKSGLARRKSGFVWRDRSICRRKINVIPIKIPDKIN
jgi:hypothetical protein